jgi:osmotically-inducible protein OsmY
MRGADQIEINPGTNMSRSTRPFAVFIAASTLALLMSCASTSTHESTGQYVDDSMITTKVKAAIFNDATLKSGEINVETFKGVVQLSGFVSSADARSHAVEVAGAVEGVKSVEDDMRVK